MNKGHAKKQPHQIILAHDGLLTMDFFLYSIQWRVKFDEHETGRDDKSLGDKRVKIAALIKGEPKWAP